MEFRAVGLKFTTASCNACTTATCMIRRQPAELGQFGPAWRDVTLSRRGYEQFDANNHEVDKTGPVPNTFTFGLNRTSRASSPTRSARRKRATWFLCRGCSSTVWMHRGFVFLTHSRGIWGTAVPVRRQPNGYRRPGWRRQRSTVDDAREAGYGDDVISRQQPPLWERSRKKIRRRW